MKNKILLCSLFFTVTVSALAPAMPSVADVFGGMSEEEITQQVKLGQQFLEDLEKFGSPEEKAQFEQLLVETLNSMSEADFNDIQQIAKMVEPSLEFPSEPITSPSVSTEAKEEKPAIKVAASEVENFQTLISTITQRIDDILQKLHSSKECSEEVDARWSSKATFNNMKRQIHQLKNKRLAQKLSSTDLTADDKTLVDTLKAFLKDLTEQNDKLVIEDDFGLPSSREVEQKHLKQTKAILAIFDNYIDSLMPKLEKFLMKWDPEALQLAKEAEEKTSKALKDAGDATVRRGSLDARPSQQAPYGAPSIPGRAGAAYQDYSAGYPSYLDQDYGAGYSPYSGYSDSTPTGSAGSGPSSSPNAAGVVGKAQPATEESKKKAKTDDTYSDIVGDIENHAEQFGQKQLDNFTSFLRNDVQQAYADLSQKINETYPRTEKQQSGQEPDVPLQDLEAKNWLANNFGTWTTDRLKDLDDYTQSIAEPLGANGPFQKEFDSISAIVNNASQSIRDMDSTANNKLASQPELAALKQRMMSYKDAVAQTKDSLNASYEKVRGSTENFSTLPIDDTAPIGDTEKDGTKYKQRNDLINDNTQKERHEKAHDDFMNRYAKAHTNIIKTLKYGLEDKIDESLRLLDNMQRTARKQATRKKSASSTAASNAING